jgi:pyridoxamine 5'-phosphate oxidase
MQHEWLESLRELLRKEYGDRPPTVSLATIGLDGSPRARTVVLRDIEGEGLHIFVSDARSEKNQELRKRPEAELVHWLPGQRVQFRVMGTAVVIRAGAQFHERLRVWRDLSDATRAMFFWPAPGERRVEGWEDFRDSVGADVDPPESFELITFLPMSVDRLDLNPHPHERRRWLRAEGLERNPNQSVARLRPLSAAHTIPADALAPARQPVSRRLPGAGAARAKDSRDG